jgi:hypothetical protein
MRAVPWVVYPFALWKVAWRTAWDTGALVVVVVVVVVVVGDAGTDVVVVVETEGGPLGPEGEESPQPAGHRPIVETNAVERTRLSMRYSRSLDGSTLAMVTAPRRFRP